MSAQGYRVGMLLAVAASFGMAARASAQDAADKPSTPTTSTTTGTTTTTTTAKLKPVLKPRVALKPVKKGEATPPPAKTEEPAPAAKETPKVTPKNAPKAAEEPARTPRQPEIIEEPVTPKEEPIAPENIETPESAEPETPPRIELPSEPIEVPAPAPKPRPRAVPEPEIAEEPRRATPADAAIEAAIAGPSTLETRNQLDQLLQENLEHPRTTEMLLRIGAINLDLNQAERARQAYDAVDKITRKDDERAAAQEGLARAAAAAGDYRGSAAKWAAIRGGATGPETVQLALNSEAMALAADNELARAEELWTQAAQAGGKPPAAALLGRALSAELQGKGDAARATLRELVAQWPDSAEAAVAIDRLADLDNALLPGS